MITGAASDIGAATAKLAAERVCRANRTARIEAVEVEIPGAGRP